MDMSRKVEPLEDYDTEKHLETIKKGEIELYENEYHLVEESLKLPVSFMQLDELEQQMVLLYVDKDYIEPESEKKTENSMFISFLAAYPNKAIIKKLFKVEFRLTGYDKFGNELTEAFKVPNPEYMDLRLKLKRHAIMVWTRSNLKEIVKTMKIIVANNGFKDDELIKQQIVSDALSEERDSFTMQNRRLAVDVYGMKKPNNLQQINVYLEGGGKKANDVIVEETGNKSYELMPDDIEEVEVVKDEN